MSNTNTNTLTIARVLLYWLVFIGLYRAGCGLSEFLQANRSFSGLGNGMAGIFACFVTTWGFLKWENRNFSSIGLIWTKATGARLIKGLLLGTGLLLFMLMIVLS